MSAPRSQATAGRTERGNPALRRADDLLGAMLCRTLPWRRRRPAPPRIERLAWVKLGAIGDVLLLTPAIDALRRAHPHAEFWGVVSPANAGVARRLGLADRWAIIDPVGDLRRPWSLLGRLTEMPRLDAALCFEQWSKGTAWLTSRLRATWRGGFWTPGHLAGRGLDWRELHRRDRHEWRNFAALAGALGARVESPRLRFPVTAAERAWAEARGFAGAVVLHPGAGGYPRSLRAWPVERFAELGRRLRRDGERLLVTGGPGERAVAERLAQALDVARVEGELGQVAAGIRVAKLVVVANTGVLHLAAAVGSPVVSPNGPVDPRRFGPLGVARVVGADTSCSPCLHLGFEYRCPDELGACMRTVTVEAVREACRTLLAPAAAGCAAPSAAAERPAASGASG